MRMSRYATLLHNNHMGCCNSDDKWWCNVIYGILICSENSILKFCWLSKFFYWQFMTFRKFCWHSIFSNFPYMVITFYEVIGGLWSKKKTVRYWCDLQHISTSILSDQNCYSYDCLKESSLYGHYFLMSHPDDFSQRRK